MSEPFLVAIRCPRCGAGTDFPEGANALRCAYCGVALRLLGAHRGGRARYLMDPVLDAAGVGAAVASYAAERGRRLGSLEWRRLLLAPFWRARGMALRWVFYRTAGGGPPAGLAHGLREDGSPFGALKAAAESLAEPGGAGGIGRALRTLLGGAGAAAFSRDAAAASPAVAYEDRGFQTRHVDLSFPAFLDANLGLVSLGVRPGVRSLRVLAADTLPREAAVLPLAVGPDAALARVAGAAGAFEEVPGQPVLERTAVVTTSLSAIYFPFWLASSRIDGVERLLVVDAVAGNVVREGEPTEPWFAGLPSLAPPPLAGSSLGFLPLTCPECAWALPLETSAVVHLCAGCGRAWQESGDRLAPVPYDAVPARNATLYLPAWRFDARLVVDGRPLRCAAELPRLLRPVGWPAPPAACRAAPADAPVALYVPAFECRALSVLERLATALTRLQPALHDPESAAAAGPLPLSPTPRAIGAALEAADAAALAALFLVGLVPGAGAAARRRLETLEVALGPARLLWLPADDRGPYLKDRLTGFTLPKAALGWAADGPASAPHPE